MLASKLEAADQEPTGLHGAEALDLFPAKQVAVFGGPTAAMAAKKIIGDRLVLVAPQTDESGYGAVDWAPLAGRSVAVVSAPVLAEQIAQCIASSVASLKVVPMSDDEWRDGLDVLVDREELLARIKARGYWLKGQTRLTVIDGRGSTVVPGPTAQSEPTADAKVIAAAPAALKPGAITQSREGFGVLMEPVARLLLGEPNERLSKAGELRFGAHGSMAIELETGRWYDHEHSVGGGVLDLIVREGAAKTHAEAMRWLGQQGLHRGGSVPTALRAKSGKPKGKTPFNIVAQYPYMDADGVLLFEVCRLDPKSFRQRRPDSSAPGGWTWNLAGITQVPYRLPQLLAAPDAEVLIFEGEKDVDAVAAPGLVATCNAGGAGKWPDSLTSYFTGRRVVITPDNDDAGRAHARLVASKLCGVAAKVRILDLALHWPEMPPKGDVSDWLAAGGTAEELLRLAMAAPVVDATVEASSQADMPKQKSDILVVDPKAPFDIARHLIARNWAKDEWRTIHRTGGAFYRWNGSHYEEQSDEAVRAALYGQLDKAVRLEDSVPFKPDSASISKIEDALRAAAHLPGERPNECWIGESGMPPAAEIIAVKNGLLHMPARNLLPHDPRFFTLNSLPFAYAADAPEPLEWLSFLKELWPDDPEAIGQLQRWFGYMLSADASHQKMLLLIGPKRSGKGTVARVMTALLGKTNVAGPTLADFSHQFGLAQLIGRRAAIVGDARLSAKVDQGEIAGRLLSITGEDVLTIDRKHREPWIGTLTARIVICSNELPRLQDASGALSSRFLILQLEQSFYGKEDRGLGDRIERELPGILRWALDGWDALQREGRFTSPSSSLEVLEELEGLSSPTKAFINDACNVKASAWVDCRHLYEAWKTWCKEQGREHPGTLQTFGRDLRAAVAGVKARQYRVGDGSRSRCYHGIELRDKF